MLLFDRVCLERRQLRQAQVEDRGRLNRAELEALDELRDTTMDPATRTLVQVTMEDAASADLVFSMLMGDQVEPRRDFIETNAKSVTNLDV